MRSYLPVDFDSYAAISQRIKAILHEFSPTCEDSGLDEAYLDISHRDEPPEQIAAAIKKRIRTETGLSCSIGIGPNKLLAKLASDMNKPDGLTVIAEADIADKVWPLPVRKLLGVGPKTEARLTTLGVTPSAHWRPPLCLRCSTTSAKRGRSRVRPASASSALRP